MKTKEELRDELVMRSQRITELEAEVARCQQVIEVLALSHVVTALTPLKDEARQRIWSHATQAKSEAWILGHLEK